MKWPINDEDSEANKYLCSMIWYFFRHFLTNIRRNGSANSLEAVRVSAWNPRTARCCLRITHIPLSWRPGKRTVSHGRQGLGQWFYYGPDFRARTGLSRLAAVAPAFCRCRDNHPSDYLFRVPSWEFHRLPLPLSDMHVLPIVSGLFLAWSRIPLPSQRSWSPRICYIQVTVKTNWAHASQKFSLCPGKVNRCDPTVPRAAGEDIKSIAHRTAITIALP